MISRRGFLRGAGAAALVAGFDPLSRRWLSTAAAATCSPGFAEVPPLDGTLAFDLASREADATDKGNIVFQTPLAVLRPGSVQDIASMITYCRAHCIKVSTRGLAHTTFGQGLSEGLVIENRSLNAIHSIGPLGAVVDTGTSWKDVVYAAFDEGLTPPSLTGYIGLTVGGTLSVGGIGGLRGATQSGMQIDNVSTLEVVTGAGDTVQCSTSQNRDLFEAMLGGLGQCGVMTKANLTLVPAKRRARTYLFHYVDNAAFFRDFRTLIRRPGLDHVYNLFFPPGTTGAIYEINATVFYNLNAPPDDLALTRGIKEVPVIVDLPYLDYVTQIDTVVEVFQKTMDWDRLIKPWFDVWLPDSKVEQYVGAVVPKIKPRDIGPAGFMLIFPQRRSRLTRPFLRVPEPDGSDWIFLFDILTASARPGPNERFTSEMVNRNDRLFRAARSDSGGVRYPIGTMTFTKDDWISHYGASWPDFSAAKAAYDPDGIMTPGPGIF